MLRFMHMQKSLPLLFITLILITLFGLVAKSASTVTLGVIVEKINQDQVNIITLRGNEVGVLLKDGTTLTSTKAEGVSFSEYIITQGANREKLKNITIEIKEASGFMPLLASFAPLGIYLVWVFVVYLIMWGGSKVFRLEIPRGKLSVYILIFFIFGLLWDYSSASLIKQGMLAYLLQALISAIISILLLKYYFLLTGKKFWQFFIYLLVVNILFSGIISFLSQ